VSADVVNASSFIGRLLLLACVSVAQPVFAQAERIYPLS
jgi:hypothetical protein